MKLDIFRIGLDPILHFEVIARCKSLKKAADELRLSQPAVTQSLIKLERGLGVQLCIRSRAGFSLTAAGKRLFQLSRSLKSELKTYENFLTESKEYDGLLSIGMIDNFHNGSFEEAVRKTIRNFPKMKLSIQVHAATEIQALVLDGELDVGLGIFNRKLDPLTYRAIGIEKIGHYISDRHPLWDKKEIRAGDLEFHVKTWVDIISRNRSALDNEIFIEGKKQVAKINSYANNLNAAVLLLRSGTSIVPLPADYLASRSLDFKYRPLNAVFPPYTLRQEAAIHREFLSTSPAARFFMDQIKFVG